MKKKSKIIIGAILLLAVVFLVVYTLLADKSPANLTEEQKKAVENAYFEEWIDSDERYLAENPIIWYDENGGVEEPGVWRYIGTYGKCQAFLRILENSNGIEMPPATFRIPFQVQGLSREVYYNEVVDVILYHTEKEFSYSEVLGMNYTGNIRLWMLHDMDNREDWLTDDQLEQLTADVEKMAEGD